MIFLYVLQMENGKNSAQNFTERLLLQHKKSFTMHGTSSTYLMAEHRRLQCLTGLEQTYSPFFPMLWMLQNDMKNGSIQTGIKKSILVTRIFLISKALHCSG